MSWVLNERVSLLIAKGTIFFDFDGTLHDSMAIYGPAFRAAYAWLVKEGYKEPQEFSDSWISQWLGFTVEEMWTTFAPDLPEVVWRKAASIVGNEMDRRTEEGKARLFEGIPEALDALKAQGYDLAFLSNCRTRYCEVHRARFGLDKWFDAYYCAESFKDIPKWQIYQEIAKTHTMPHVMVGDRFHDQEVAVRAHIPFVGCAFGFGREGELDQADAWARVPSEIPGAVKAALTLHS